MTTSLSSFGSPMRLSTWTLYIVGRDPLWLLPHDLYLELPRPHLYLPLLVLPSPSSPLLMLPPILARGLLLFVPTQIVVRQDTLSIPASRWGWWFGRSTRLVFGKM